MIHLKFDITINRWHVVAIIAAMILLKGGSVAFAAWTGPTAAPPGNNASAPINVGVGDQVKNGGLSVNTLAVFGSSLINSTSPTLFLQDTDNRSAMIHNNSNLLYFLRGCGNASLSWCTTNSMWPLVINLENNDATFGGKVGINKTPASAQLDVAAAGRAAQFSSSGEHGVVSYGPASGSGGYGVWGQSGSYYAALGRADGYSIVGSGELYNAGVVRSTSGGFAFPDGTVQTTAAAGGGITAATSVFADCGTICSSTATCPAGYYRTGCGGTNSAPSGSNACRESQNTGQPIYAYCAR